MKNIGCTMTKGVFWASLLSITHQNIPAHAHWAFMCVEARVEWAHV
jgi:hypothetical protein